MRSPEKTLLTLIVLTIVLLGAGIFFMYITYSATYNLPTCCQPSFFQTTNTGHFHGLSESKIIPAAFTFLTSSLTHCTLANSIGYDFPFLARGRMLSISTLHTIIASTKPDHDEKKTNAHIPPSTSQTYPSLPKEKKTHLFWQIGDLLCSTLLCSTPYTYSTLCLSISYMWPFSSHINMIL